VHGDQIGLTKVGNKNVLNSIQAQVLPYYGLPNPALQPYPVMARYAGIEHEEDLDKLE